MTGTDGTGSLFLFGGLADDPSAGQDRPVPASTVSSPTRDGAVIELNDLWRYDTGSLAWQLIHAPSNSSAAGQQPWPAARTRATLWRDAAPNAHSTTVWMLGGISSPLGGPWPEMSGDSSVADFFLTTPGVGMEFWRYSYAYESGGAPSAPRAARLGEWTLVTGLPNQQRTDVQPIKACEPVSTREGGQSVGFDCPPARVDAGSWSSPHQQAGGCKGPLALNAPPKCLRRPAPLLRKPPSRQMLRRDFRRPGFERCQRRRRPPRGSDLPHTAEPRRVAGRSVELQRRHDRPTLDTNRAAATTVTCLKLVDVAGEHDRLQPTALVGLRLNIDAPPLLPLPALSRPGTPRSPLRTRACVLPFRTANRPGVCPLRFAERASCCSCHKRAMSARCGRQDGRSRPAGRYV